ncbi:MAG: response regulator [Anaerolineae bacterium]|nr:response regulator [Anaerolineae bacterium]
MNETQITILLIEDNDAHSALIERAFQTRAPQITLHVVGTLNQAQKLLAATSVDLVIADWLLPDGQGIDLLPADTPEPPFPVILMTSYGNERVAVDAMKAGVLDYVVKSAETLIDLPHIAERALREWHYLVERRQSEREISRLQHLLQNITDSMPSALITLDAQGCILTWNPAAETLTRCTTEQVKRHVLWDTCPMLERYRDLFDQVLQSQKIAHRHREAIQTSHETRFYDVDVFPLFTDGVTGAVLRVDDVTQRVHIEEMMLQSTKMASVGGLAAGVAHEINNPLGAIMQSAQLLQLSLDTQNTRTRTRLEAAGLDPDHLEAYLQERNLLSYIQGIRDMGARAAKIVSDLLSFSRKGISNPAPRDLNALIEQTLELAATDYDLRRQYDFRNIEIVYALDRTLPRVICEGQQIQQVVLNLVRNAAQAMAEKRANDLSYKPRLTLRTTWIDTYVRVDIQDNGTGIPEATRTRLFEPFFTTKEVGEGTGLGLWLCWSIIVERHGGHIWAEPAEGAGACFAFELPIAGR